MEKIKVKTARRVELVDITEEIQNSIESSKFKDGVCTVFVPHTTAGITINENADPDVQRDIINEINKIIPFEDNYFHTEGNSAAHIKASIIGSSINVIVENCRLQLGTWQGICFVEFDGPRTREVWVKLK